MKVLISDFDGTLFVDEEGLIKNSKKIKEFRKKGNIFIINTARNFYAIKKSCIDYKIDVDYFFCDLGSVILDNNGNVLYKKYINRIDRNIIEKIIEMYEQNIIVKRYGTNDKQSKDILDVVEYKIEGKYEILSAIKSQIQKNIIDLKTQITEDNKLIVHSNTKQQVIDYFVKKNNINIDSVYTIGDELDDLEMLMLYNGYRMTQCNEKIKQSIEKNVKTIADLIDLLDN